MLVLLSMALDFSSDQALCYNFDWILQRKVRESQLELHSGEEMEHVYH